MTNPIIDHIAPYVPELTAIRRDIHAHPEIGMEEYRTSELVAKQLEAWGVEVHRGVGKTGVVGVLRNGAGPAIGLRADMDALPIHEQTNLEYSSRNPGVMHACGHDGHTTMLLGAARYLAETRNFTGTVNFIFQPGEEGMGGALAMLEDKLFERFPCDAIFGMHNAPGMPVGKFGISPGTAMAAGAFFDITITGRGAHGARPEESIDPVQVAGTLASALQSIVARNISPSDTAVLSVTRMLVGDAYNVIPETGLLGGTVRTMKRETMALIEANMRRLATNIASGYGADAKVDFRLIFAPLVNDAAQLTVVADAAALIVGDAEVNRARPPVMASEDFAFMMEKIPGAFINLGNGGESAPVHNHQYNFNDAAIPYGVALWASVVESKLAK